MSLVAAYLASVVSKGNHSVAAIAALVIAVVAYLGSVWWDSAHQSAAAPHPRVDVDQKARLVRDGSLTGVDTDDGTGGDHTVRQRVKKADHTDVVGVRIRRAPPTEPPG